MSKEMHAGLYVKCLLLSSISDHHNSLPFLKVILKKLHMLLKMPFVCLAAGLHFVMLFCSMSVTLPLVNLHLSPLYIIYYLIQLMHSFKNTFTFKALKC
jgi:hypothetical protein